jgi:hypothetical protein
MDYYGKCSRCEMVKKDYEVCPQPYDLLLCKLCYSDVQKNALRDHSIEQILGDVETMLNDGVCKTELIKLKHDLLKLMSHN